MITEDKNEIKNVIKSEIKNAIQKFKQLFSEKNQEQTRIKHNGEKSRVTSTSAFGLQYDADVGQQEQFLLPNTQYHSPTNVEVGQQELQQQPEQPTKIFLEVENRIPGQCCRIGCNEKTTAKGSTCCLTHKLQKQRFDERNRDIKRQLKNKQQRMAAANHAQNAL